MNRIALFFALLAAVPSSGQATPERITGPGPISLELSTPEHEADISNQIKWGYIAWHWSGGYFVQAQVHASPRQPAVTIFDRDGIFVRDVVFWLDGADDVDLSDVASRGDGELVVSGSAIFPRPAEGTFYSDYFGNLRFFLAEIGPEGQIAKQLSMGLYSAANICADEDGTIWTWGTEHPTKERQGSSERAWSSIFPTLRHYSFANGLLFDSGMQLETRNLKPNSQGSSTGGSEMVCGKDFVGVYDGHYRRWVEYDRETRSVTARPAPMIAAAKPTYREKVTGMAATGDGEVYASIQRYSSLPNNPDVGHSIYKLDRSNPSAIRWIQVKGKTGNLFGSDGNTLVYTEAGLPPVHVAWSDVIAAPPKAEIAAKP